ncbi:VanZ family protein [Hamadaea tsunoensis]|uniref:VanZ family protein n=1 Tax=Hamadaea tsunoensis TaxID=53368 RepID=UPI00041EE2ED|nr:VanZ family protein [Hamadaea tsunoensis]
MISEQLHRWALPLWVTLALVPVALVVAPLRRRGVPEAVIVLGTFPWTWMALTPLGGTRTVALVPLVDLYDQVTSNPAAAFPQVFANLVFLLPFGAAAPFWRLWFRRFRRVFLVAAAFSALIEFLQYALGLGRVSSIDDVLQNATGALIGALLTWPWWRSTRRGVRAARHPVEQASPGSARPGACAADRNPPI